MDSRAGRTLAHRAARTVVRVATLGAPGRLRERMRREWEAELEREFGRGGGWGVVRSAFGAFADVSAVRRIDRDGEEKMAGRMSEWTRDARVSARALLRSPSFTAVTVLTLAIGLGGSAAIYTLVDRVVLDPLPYPDSERLVRLENQVPGVGPDEVWALSTAQYVYLTENAETLSELGLYQSSGGNVLTPDGPRRANLHMVTASALSVLGVEAHLGRVIGPADDAPGAPNAVMLSHGFWTRELGSDAGIVGSSISFNDVPMEVLGVLRPGFQIPGLRPSAQPDILIPMRIDPARGFSNNHVYGAIGRIADGATLAALETELTQVLPRLPEVFPNVYSEAFFEQYGFRTVATPLKDSVVGELGRILWFLFGGVGLVLFIAAANVANLFLVRVEGKRREIDIRTALGAGRATIGRYLLSEALILALAGGVVAIVVAFWGLPALTALAPEELPRLQGARMGPGTVVFTVGLCALVGLFVAALPWLARTTGGGRTTGDRTATDGPRRHRLRSALVAGQMALALALVVGAADLLQSLRALQTTDPGMDADGAMAVSLYMNPHTYAADTDLWIVYQRILEEVEAIPGVSLVGMGEQIPVSGSYGCTVQGFEDQRVYDRVRAAGATTCAGQTRVTPGYFEALEHPDRGRVVPLDDRRPRRPDARLRGGQPGVRGPLLAGREPDREGRRAERPYNRAPFYRVVGVAEDVAEAPRGRPSAARRRRDRHLLPDACTTPTSPGNWGWWWPGNMRLVVRTEEIEPGFGRARRCAR